MWIGKDDAFIAETSYSRYFKFSTYWTTLQWGWENFLLDELIKRIGKRHLKDDCQSCKEIVLDWKISHNHFVVFLLFVLSIVVCRYGTQKSERGKKTDAVRQAILNQFNKRPRPSHDVALKAVRASRKPSKC